MTEGRFWRSSPREIIDFIDSYNRRAEKKRKDEISDIFLLARLIACDIAVDDNHPEPKPWDYYPDLFAKEKVSYSQAEKETELEDYKEKRLKYIRTFNLRMQAAKKGAGKT